MRLFILLGSLLELGAGIIFFFLPTMIPGLEGDNAFAMTFSKMYGVAAIAIASIGIAAWQRQDKLLTKEFLRMFLIFHLGIALATYYGYSAGIEILLGGVGFHSLMGLLSAFFYGQLIKV